MKKVGIITINDINYGNRLQCYATQCIIDSLGCVSENIFNGYKPYPGKRNKIKHIIALMLLNKKHISEHKRIKKFNTFNKRIRFSRFDLKKDNEKQISDYYDTFFVGSDQVWNPLWMGKDEDFLYFAERAKRNSFSASFGIDEIPVHQIDRYRKNLMEFNNISVREETGAQIIKKLTGRDCTVLVDPTLILKREQWTEVANKPKGANEGYILTYFLSSKSNEAEDMLNRIRDERKVYELLDINDKVAGTAGPSEFIWLISHADIVLTDSFHACIFSFIFNKPFVVFDRNWNDGNMNSRLETFLSKFKLERKYYGNKSDNDIWEHNYNEGYKQLCIERKNTYDFLNKIIKE